MDLHLLPGRSIEAVPDSSCSRVAFCLPSHYAVLGKVVIPVKIYSVHSLQDCQDGEYRGMHQMARIN